MAHVVAVPRSDSEFRAVVAGVRADRPFAERARFADRALKKRAGSLALHAGWEQFRAGSLWTIGAAFQRATSTAGIASGAAGGIVERLVDGPPLALVAPAGSSRTHWDVQAGFTAPALRWLGTNHLVRVGASVAGAGLPATAGHSRPLAAWTGSGAGLGRDVPRQRIAPRLDLRERVRQRSHRPVGPGHAGSGVACRQRPGSATGAATAIHWFTATPRVTLRWRPADSVVITSGYAWYGHQLPLSYLAVGDPSGTCRGDVRWDNRNGDGRFSPSELPPSPPSVRVVRPRGPASSMRVSVDRSRASFESASSTRSGLAMGHHRPRSARAPPGRARQHRRDGSGLRRDVIDDPESTSPVYPAWSRCRIYDRTPASFLRDAYRLTNPTRNPRALRDSTHGRSRDRRLASRFGGSAYRSKASGPTGAITPARTIQGLLGEVFTNPNATTHARGRLFYDRAFVMKVLGGYQSKGPLGAWFMARYQDGQPFARVVVAEGLNQGRRDRAGLPARRTALHLHAYARCPRRAAMEHRRPAQDRRPSTPSTCRTCSSRSRRTSRPVEPSGP